MTINKGRVQTNRSLGGFHENSIFYDCVEVEFLLEIRCPKKLNKASSLTIIDSPGVKLNEYGG